MTTATKSATKVNPVEAFLMKVREDGQIRSQIEALKTQEKDQAIQEICRIANKIGFKFNAKQYEQYARMTWTRTAKPNRAMTDQELILVACGCC
ncbi:MAG TPA: Nif11-like leader peptide family natural product precursor [Pirellulales bacterium]|jgi:hypothetical protein